LEVFVQEAVLRLPEEEQLAVSLFYLGGHSLEEIAALLPAPLGTVKKRLWQARQRLRERMLGQVREHQEGGWPSKVRRSVKRVRHSMILFSASHPQGSQYYAMDSTTAAIRPLPTPEGCAGMEWFPDGEQVLSVVGPIVRGIYMGRHYLMKRDGSARRAIGPEGISGSRISPDGKKIAFTTVKDHPGLFPEYNRSELYVMEADGTQVLRLTHNLVEDTAPAWTPEGKILFARDVSGRAQQFQLWAIEADGTGETPFPPRGPEVFGNWPEFSPDGSRIAFTLYDGQKWDLWVMEADGTTQLQLTDLPGSWISAPPRWSPDGLRLVFAANHRLYVVAADGSSGLRPEPIHIKETLKGINTPTWVPAAAG
jgi:Tol biopolymer transport system component